MAAKKRSTPKTTKSKPSSTRAKAKTTSKTNTAKKTSSAKRASSPSSAEHALVTQKPASTVEKNQKPGFTIQRSHIITFLVILAIIGLLYAFRSQFVVATVNGQPITRMEYNKQLEQQSGKQVMNSLVTKTLIEQEASKEHVTVSDKEITDEINKVKSDLQKQGQSLDQALALRGLTMNDLKEQIRIQKLIEKMLGKDIQVSDKEVDDYIQKNQISQDNTTGTPPLSRDAVKQQLQQQKLNAKFTPWLQKLQEKAKINYFVNV